MPGGQPLGGTLAVAAAVGHSLAGKMRPLSTPMHMGPCATAAGAKTSGVTTANAANNNSLLRAPPSFFVVHLLGEYLHLPLRVYEHVSSLASQGPFVHAPLPDALIHPTLPKGVPSEVPSYLCT
jgi:hypothetical protein